MFNFDTTFQVLAAGATSWPFAVAAVIVACLVVGLVGRIADGLAERQEP